MLIEPFLPRFEKHFSLIGQIAFLWNGAEASLDLLISSFVASPANKQPFGATHVIASKLANRDRLTVLRTLNEQNPLGERGDKIIENIAKTFSILNENRNTLVHSRLLYPSTMSNLTWQRSSKSKPGQTAYAIASLNDLKSQVKTLENFNVYLFVVIAKVSVYLHDNDKTRIKWPRKFPLPRKLHLPHREDGCLEKPLAYDGLS